MTAESSPDQELDPEMAVIVARMLARMASRPPMGTDTPAVMRARFAEDMKTVNADPPPLPRVEDRLLATAQRQVPVRLYDPVGDGLPRPALIYFHGGGWIVGDLDSNDRALRLLAIESGLNIVSVDYKLAPEHTYPEPLQDCIDSARALRTEGASWGLDIDRLALGGDSAGANLALATALGLSRAGEHWPRYLLLMYGAYAREYDTESNREFGDGRFGFSTQAMAGMWSLYMGKTPVADLSLAEPLAADLRGLPPACVIAAGLDLLRDDSRKLAARLVGVGVQVEFLEFRGVTHGFMSMTRDLTAARRAAALAGSALRRGLARQ